jgi:hypothetical protein
MPWENEQLENIIITFQVVRKIMIANVFDIKRKNKQNGSFYL